MLQEYERGLAAGELRYQRCVDCDRAQFPPRVLCVHCSGGELRWATSNGRACVYSVSWLSPRDAAPYNVALVDLDDGFRMLSTVRGVTPEDALIDSPVHAVVSDGTVRFELTA
jgi:uncharacterized OB-fold protein